MVKPGIIKPMPSPYALVIYIDGSYRPQLKKGGLALVVHFPEAMNRAPEAIASLPYTPTTINQMELEACVRALRYIQANTRNLNINHAIIYSDSQYVVEGQRHCNQWNKDKWYNHQGLPIKNASVWKIFMRELRKAREITKVEILKIAGKSSPETIEVDMWAKTASSTAGGTRYSAPQRTRIGRTLGKDKRPPIKFEASGQKVYGRIYTDMSAGKYIEVRFEIYDSTINELGRRYIAFAKSEMSHKVHRGHYYSLVFGKNRDLPLILKLSKMRNPPQLKRL